MIIMDVSVMLLSTHLSKFLTFIVFLDKLHSQPLSANARLRGWRRITTKLKRNNCNHRGSLGLETPRVDSPS